ncbi:L,D-transpeptidase family protein [Psychrobacter aquaticus]|uniref:ERFK/SRFK protein n=1 Tax=Psychrobacter aquaticus CMS 56 TaxID=1354303 RepID=U4T1Z5_9GAMM|nr:L,D-transpeptidase family protein [Psychrobacter aquaticus]ERL54882.1 ERFK/SRFK protein [Psychrobacter aquaticus CMS 56]
MSQLLKVGRFIVAIGTTSALLVGCSNASTTDKNVQTTNASQSSESGATDNSTGSNTDSTAANDSMNADTESEMNGNTSQSSDMKNTDSTGNTINNTDGINTNSTMTDSNDTSPVTNGVSQQIEGNSKTANSLNRLLPKIQYSTGSLSETTKKVNQATWKASSKIDRNVGTKLQALLNWNHSGVGAVDGYWGKNTRKAMQAFQKAQGLPVTEEMNTQTWQALTKNSSLISQPVLVSYQLTDADVNVKTIDIPASAEAKAKLDGMYYESVLEALGEKFHISRDYLKSLNPSASFKIGETIIVYNPGNPNTTPVSRVVADKSTQTLYAYDDNNNLIASYPTTVGSTATPSPTGTHQVKVKIHEPNYTYTDDDGKKSIIPPGPNNPVGLVWIGLSKPSYGIHGSPDPERISRQASAGCVRLTNWDALSLLGVIENDATVEFN